MKEKSLKHITICDVFVLLFFVYNYADMFIHTSFAALGTYIPMLLICLYGFYQTTFKYNPKGLINALAIFLSFLMIYGFFYWLVGDDIVGTKRTSFLFGNIFSLCPIFLFYISTIKGTVNGNRMRLYALVFILIAILRYVNIFTVREIAISDVSFTNNIAYYFVLLLPTIFLFEKKPIVQYALLLLLLFFVIRGMKRGAIITAGSFIMVFLFYFRNRNAANKGVWKTLLPWLLFFISIAAMYFSVQNVWIGNDYFQTRVDESLEGNMNGREDIYGTLWKHFLNNTNFFQLLFGMGAEATVTVCGTHAHNDWLELLTDCGILGIIIYISYYIAFFREGKKYRKKSPESYIVISCGVMFFIRSFFSMSYMDIYLGASSVLGYSLAVCQQNKYLHE